jgi:hypothetical protein
MRAASPLQQFIARAVELRADTIHVEYRDGYEEVSVAKGGVGFEIARFPSMGRCSTALRKELAKLQQQKRTTVTISDAAYEIRARAYELFAEEAWEVRLRPVASGAAAGSHGSRGGTNRRVGLRASDSEPAL